MSLPPRSFYSVNEVAARWECCPTDIAGWALAGRLPMMTAVGPLACGAEPVVGLVQINAADIMAMFRDFHQVGTTLVISTHDDRAISALGGRIVHLDHGRVQEEGAA
jgi:ABC-type arginine transport system ATPase subunit